MIGSTLIEQNAADRFLFSSIETGLFRVERALPNTRATSVNKPKPCVGFLVSARRWQAPLNPAQSRFSG